MRIYQKYGSLLKHFMLDLHTLEGDYDADTLKMVVADDGSTLDYFSQLVFPEGAKVTKTGRTTALRCLDLIDSNTDLVVLGVNSMLSECYAQRGFRIIPKWLKMIMPVKEDPYSWFSSFGKRSRSYFNRKLHKIEEFGYTCEVTHDRDSFVRFYDDMYKPYSVERFDNDAVVYNIDVLEKFFSQGFLVISKKNGHPTAGVVVHQDGAVMHLLFGGISGADPELVKEGAMFAIHYYLAEQAHSWGYQSIDFGRCRPFVSDGSLQYKLNWHTEPTLCDDVSSVFAIATPRMTAQAMKFMSSQPHFYLDGKNCLRSDE